MDGVTLALNWYLSNNMNVNPRLGLRQPLRPAHRRTAAIRRITRATPTAFGMQVAVPILTIGPNNLANSLKET